MTWESPNIKKNGLPRSEWWNRLILHAEFYDKNIHHPDCGDENVIYDFHEPEYVYLSNFYKSEIVYNGKVFKSTEHAYQAEKTLDPDWHEAIRLAETPNKSKKKGRACPLRPDWHIIKFDIMREVLHLKFQDPKLREKLLSTGNKYIVEGTVWHDNVFGCCILNGCNHYNEFTKAYCRDELAENWLGYSLMELRRNLLLECV